MKSRAREWLLRYAPGEVFGTIFAVVGAYLVFLATGNHVAAAFAGAWSENIGFYGWMSASEVMKSVRRHRQKKITYTVFSFFRNIRNLLIEFGVSEALDSFVTRPALMYIGPLVVGNFVLGTLAGKICADVFFYLFAIIAYEIRKKYLGE